MKRAADILYDIYDNCCCWDDAIVHPSHSSFCCCQSFFLLFISSIVIMVTDPSTVEQFLDSFREELLTEKDIDVSLDCLSKYREVLANAWDDIIGLEENLNCSVVTNHLRRCDGYGIVQEIFT